MTEEREVTLNQNELNNMFPIRVYMEAGEVQNVEMQYRESELKNFAFRYSDITIIRAGEPTLLSELDTDEQSKIRSEIEERLPIMRMISVEDTVNPAIKPEDER